MLDWPVSLCLQQGKVKCYRTPSIFSYLIQIKESAKILLLKHAGTIQVLSFLTRSICLLLHEKTDENTTVHHGMHQVNIKKC